MGCGSSTHAESGTTKRYSVDLANGGNASPKAMSLTASEVDMNVQKVGETKAPTTEETVTRDGDHSPKAEEENGSKEARETGSESTTKDSPREEKAQAVKEEKENSEEQGKQNEKKERENGNSSSGEKHDAEAEDSKSQANGDSVEKVETGHTAEPAEDVEQSPAAKVEEIPKELGELKFVVDAPDTEPVDENVRDPNLHKTVDEVRSDGKFTAYGRLMENPAYSASYRGIDKIGYDEDGNEIGYNGEEPTRVEVTGEGASSIETTEKVVSKQDVGEA